MNERRYEKINFYDCNYFPPFRLFWFAHLAPVPANTYNREYTGAHCNTVRITGFKYSGPICDQYPAAYNDSAYWNSDHYRNTSSNLYTNHTGNHYA